MAINQLRRLPPGDAHYDEAQALISQWEAAVEPGAGQGEAPSPEALAQRFELVAQATTALEGGENLEALEGFDRAAAIAPLEGPDAELRDRAERALEPIESEVEMFRDGDYEPALPRLWRLHQDEPGNLDVLRMLIDSYYNLAVRDLQRGDTKVAAQKLKEAAALAPDDPELVRHLRFAETYRERPPDLQYRIYVKYLPSR
jgi:tetratricopeptide (TPR) repeat protein